MATATSRMKRVGRIQVPFHGRCQLAAAAGTAAGICGAACGSPPARELDVLRRAARAAVCHGLWTFEPYLEVGPKGSYHHRTNLASRQSDPQWQTPFGRVA
jgi:hypothetical protein